MSATGAIGLGLALLVYGATGVALWWRERRRPEPEVWESTACGTRTD